MLPVHTAHPLQVRERIGFELVRMTARGSYRPILLKNSLGDFLRRKYAPEAEI